MFSITHKLTIFSVLFFLIYACGKEGKYIYTIKNHSKEKFILTIKPWEEDTSLVEINAETTYTFFAIVTNGSAPVDRGINFLNPFQSIELISKDSIHLKKDFHEPDRWDFFWGKGNGSYKDGVAEYSFSITSSDIDF